MTTFAACPRCKEPQIADEMVYARGKDGKYDELVCVECAKRAENER